MLKYNEFITEGKMYNTPPEHPFILAAKRGSYNKIKDLIKSGVDMNMQDNIGITALMWTASEGFLMAVITLIDAGADVNLTDYQHRTALMMAKTNSIINKILSVDNVDVNIQDDKGNTVMIKTLAYTINSKTIISLLERFLEKGLDLDIKNVKNRNFYEELQYKILNYNHKKLSELYEIEKYIDDNFPKYREEWDKNKWDIDWYWQYQMNRNKEKFNL